MTAATVTRYYERVDANDTDGVVALFAEDCWYERPGYDALVGREALREFYAGTRVIVAGRHHIDRTVEDDRGVAVEGRFEGRLKDGREVALRFADFFQVEQGCITGRRTYFYAPLV